MFNHARMLIGAERIGEAIDWIARMGPIATPAFRAKAARWLRERGDARLIETADRLSAIDSH